MRAVQVMLFKGSTLKDVSKELTRLKSSGVDTIILRVFHNEGDRYYHFVSSDVKAGVYFKTKHAPVVADVLSEVVRMARKKGLKIFAWMTTRYADYGLPANHKMKCRGYDVEQRRYVDCKGLDLFSERAVRRLENIYKDLASYDIDGILFQDDLVLRYNEGFGPRARALFARDSGGALRASSFYRKRPDSPYVSYTPEFWTWAAWKNKRLLSVARRLKHVVRQKNPGVKFAINLMYESVTDPKNALAWFSQDLSAVVEMGFDYYSIMAYQNQIGRELRKDKKEVEDMIAGLVKTATLVVGDHQSVLIKLQTIDWTTGEPLPSRDVVRLLRRVKSTAGVGLAVVPYRAEGFPYHELRSTAGKFSK